MTTSRNIRNRRSKKQGSSWLARCKRLRIAFESTNSDGDVQGEEECGGVQSACPGNEIEQPQTTPPTEVSPPIAQRSAEHHVHSAAVRKEDIKEVVRSSNMVTKPTLLAVLTLYGACAFTSRQYEYLCLILSIVNSEFRLPCVTTVRKRKWPFFTSYIFPKSYVISLPRKDRFVTPVDRTYDSEYLAAENAYESDQVHGPTTDDIIIPTTTSLADLTPESDEDEARPEGPQQHDRQQSSAPNRGTRRPAEPLGTRPTSNDSSAKAAFVPISSWAKLDVSNILLRDKMVRGQRSAVNDHDVVERTIEHSRLCSDYESLCTEQNGLGVHTETGLKHTAKRNDRLQLRCIRQPSSTTHYPAAFDPIENSATEVLLSGTVSFTFCPGVLGDTSEDNATLLSNYVSVDRAQLSTDERSLVQYMKVSTRSRSDDGNTGDDTRFSIFPGDIVTVLKPNDVGQDSITTFGVIINRYWRTSEDTRTQLFFSFRCNLTNRSSASLESTFTAELNGIPRITNFRASDRSSYRKANTYGKLRDGRFFYVYRVLLYCDDFLPRSPLFPKGSVGGVYFLPLSLQSSRRRGSSSVRTISLTPNGVSTNEILDRLIPDIIKAMTDGIRTLDADGTEVYVFIEIVGFVGDYPESAKVIDVMGHAARAPCTVCTFRHRTLVDAARFAYSILIHSSNCTFTRSLRRTLSLRSAAPSSDDLRFLGMDAGTLDDVEQPGRWPLLKLACAIDNIKSNIPLTDTHEPVVSTSFDPYVRNAVAPDHLLAGIGKFLIESLFVLLTSDAQRLRLDLVVCRELRRLGMGTHSTLYNLKTKSLHSISISTVFTTLMIVPHHFRALNLSDQKNLVPVIESYYKLVALTFWWPSETVDGKDAFAYVHGPNQDLYHGDMIELVESFVQTIGTLSDGCSQIRERLDRPNIHRILELYHSTIPRFSHALFCLDMAFEHNHQPLKASLQRNSNPNCYIGAVYHSLGVDWFSRLCELAVHKEGLPDPQLGRLPSIRRSLRRLFFGERALELERHPRHNRDLLRKLDDQIEDTLQPEFVTLLVKWYSSRLSNFPDGSWIGTFSKHRRPSSCTIQVQNVSQHNLRHHLQVNSTKTTKMFTHVTYIQQIGHIKRRHYVQHRVHVDDFVGCLLNENSRATPYRRSCLVPSSNGTGNFNVFRVCAFIGFEHDNVWALAVKGRRVETQRTRNLYSFQPPSSTTVVVLQMTSTVRKCYGMHACDVDGSCTVDTTSKSITHCLPSTCALTFSILDRKKGYPPRRS